MNPPAMTPISTTKTGFKAAGNSNPPVYWRVEGSLLELSALAQLGFFTWNAQSFAERSRRRLGMALMALLRPLAFLGGGTFATRLLYTLLRGVSRDHVLRPLARHVGVEQFIGNSMEFRDGVATGRLLDPVIRPRAALAWLGSGENDGRVEEAKLLRQMGLKDAGQLAAAIGPAERVFHADQPAVVSFGTVPEVGTLSVRRALAGKNILLIGVTGFIGKVWLVDLLEQVPDLGKVTLLIRRNRTTTAQRRFEKIVEESPTLDGLQKTYGPRLGAFLRDRIEVVEGDVSQPGLGLEEAVRERLARSLDLVVNSAGLTDFNPDLREALSSNVESAEHLLDFLRATDRAALMHLSTCYVVGMRDGRVAEDLQENYNPAGVKNFDAEREIASLREMIVRIEERAESVELARALRR